MKIVIYRRVSSEEQAEKYGLDAQRHALLGLAARRGYTVVADVADEGISGTIAERPGLARVRDLLRSGQAEGVLVYDPSRLARETVLGLTILTQLHALGKVEFLARPSEDTPDGKMLNTIEAAFAERERAKLIERTKAGRLAKMRRGLVPCGPYPFGYRPEQPGKGEPYTQPGGLCVVEAEAKLVRQLYSWAEEGVSIRQMCIRLAASGAKAPRGGPWSKPTITKLLRNPVYKGTFIRDRLTSDKKQAAWVRVERPEAEWIRISVTPIVSAVTWERAQGCFERNRSRLVGRPDKREYLLRGLLVCRLCGKRYVGGASRGTRVYRCSGRDSLLGEHRCLGSRTLIADTVEREVKAAITDVLNNPRRLLGVEAYQAREGAKHGEIRHEAEEVARALRDVRARRARLLDLAIDGTVGKAVFSERDAPLAAEEERLARRAEVLAKAVAGSAAQAARARAVEAQARLLRSGLDRLDFAGWRRFLAPLVDHIRVRPEALEVGFIFAPPAQAAEETPATSRARIRSLDDADRRAPAHAVEEAVGLEDGPEAEEAQQLLVKGRQASKLPTVSMTWAMPLTSKSAVHDTAQSLRPGSRPARAGNPAPGRTGRRR